MPSSSDRTGAAVHQQRVPLTDDLDEQRDISNLQSRHHGPPAGRVAAERFRRCCTVPNLPSIQRSAGRPQSRSRANASRRRWGGTAPRPPWSNRAPVGRGCVLPRPAGSRPRPRRSRTTPGPMSHRPRAADPRVSDAPVLKSSRPIRIEDQVDRGPIAPVSRRSSTGTSVVRRTSQCSGRSARKLSGTAGWSSTSPGMYPSFDDTARERARRSVPGAAGPTVSSPRRSRCGPSPRERRRGGCRGSREERRRDHGGVLSQACRVGRAAARTTTVRPAVVLR